MTGHMAFASLGLAVLLLTGCAPSQAPTSSTPASAALSASTSASAAVAGTFVPVSTAASVELVSLSMTGDGQVSQELTSTQPAARFSQTFGGTWRVGAPSLLVFQRGDVSATYRYSSAGDTLTLTWVDGTAPGAGGISAGPIHFQTAEGDSWITGSRGSMQLTRRR